MCSGVGKAGGIAARLDRVARQRQELMPRWSIPVTPDQITLFALLLFVFAFLIWGRWRYDLVAFIALLAAILTGVVPSEQAFSGFGHPAVVIIALVLIVSRGLSDSGAIELLARFMVSGARKLATHIAMMASLAAGLSAIMNNVAALALLMPLDIQAAKTAERSPALSLMPLSFASILGGMITLIGTPPNIVIAEFRNDALGEPYRMFDFAPVGLVCAAVGILFVTLIGWRLLPVARTGGGSGKELFDLADYIAELVVPEDCRIIGTQVHDLDDEADKSGVDILGLLRKGRRMPGLARTGEVRAGDVLVVEGDPPSIEDAIGRFGLEYVGAGEGALADDDLALIEVVVTESSAMVGRTASSFRLPYRYRATLVGVSREGQRFREGVRKLALRPGDVLLLLGGEERLNDVNVTLGLL
ncbi:MAG: SLC13 family permease, partial [Gammaproteobacteria bacterium]|nr:SLC13 family permease [Gammaproteobacteria bacterium]